jgi:hypothetical protein
LSLDIGNTTITSLDVTSIKMQQNNSVEGWAEYLLDSFLDLFRPSDHREVKSHLSTLFNKNSTIDEFKNAFERLKEMSGEENKHNFILKSGDELDAQIRGRGVVESARISIPNNETEMLASQKTTTDYYEDEDLHNTQITKTSFYWSLRDNCDHFKNLSTLSHSMVVSKGL